MVRTWKFSVKPFVRITIYSNVSRTFSREELLKYFFPVQCGPCKYEKFTGQESEVVVMGRILLDNIPLLRIKHPRYFEGYLDFFATFKIFLWTCFKVSWESPGWKTLSLERKNESQILYILLSWILKLLKERLASCYWQSTTMQWRPRNIYSNFYYIWHGRCRISPKTITKIQVPVVSLQCCTDVTYRQMIRRLVLYQINVV
jgi:hypothetical protein